MDAQTNLLGYTTKFVWMHNKTCKHAQQNLYGCTTKFVWMPCVKKNIEEIAQEMH